MSPARTYQDGRVDALTLAIKELHHGKKILKTAYDKWVMDCCIDVVRDLKADAVAEAKLGRTLLKGKA